MNKKRKGARRWTALALSVAMVFSGIGILPAPVKAEAADVAAAVQKTGATTERSERKMKFGDDWKPWQHSRLTPSIVSPKINPPV